MNNIADALKMAFAVFVFVIALSIVFYLITEVRETADTILFYADETNYYKWETGTLENGRIVGVDTVIATLKNYTTQDCYVIVDDIEYNYSSGMDNNIKEFIELNINKASKYYEKVLEITTDGEYRTGDDGTRITIRPGTTRTYIIYTKI